MGRMLGFAVGQAELALLGGMEELTGVRLRMVAQRREAAAAQR